VHDFKVGRDLQAGRDVIINDHSQKIKLLRECTNEELFEEEPFRKGQLKIQTSKKGKRLLITWVCLLLLVSLGSGVLYLRGKPDLAHFALAIGSFVVSMLSLRGYLKPNAAELDHINAISEINHILMVRGIR
jgi:hypothetical protein